MQKIVPNLWFDHTAEEAATFYASVFPNARIIDIHRYPDEGLPDFQKEFAGQPVTVEFELGGYRLVGINAGPEFRPNPSVSFFVNFDPSVDDQAREHLDDLWTALAAEGSVLMPLQEYPYSRRYGWVEDKWGVSWQLMLTNPEGEPRPFIVRRSCSAAPSRDGPRRPSTSTWGCSVDVRALSRPTRPRPARSPAR